ncbi:mannitol-1-phosphate 5-dehydrogenase [Weissella sagaensis]|uniref:mannitol-1-phosphate 5-dehydrogenase n=1 Tax=Weissella sagaensis TaxID=2559928 RepID=UPI00123AF2B0|nr:mannitol-1-phosphate 5-dehydrogenase [Weissella sagaensis]KAA8434525.1 mannitol-1-phosphate 5-dehydrogenase [Weissella paramesenteroides]KAA8437484.1 mannitol-1-phosphate 5-dehydrogenase [Weissella paramesenteroides]MBU7567549.1 mannitol-1-phosphate 5-dehydrogenase [Weissella hellenica]
MKAVHFGAGNIGRGFIGETLAANDFSIDFVDVNDTIISALQERHEYEIELAATGQEKILVKNVDGINNGKEPEKVVAAIAEADIVTTAIGPKILKFIAPLIADGLVARKQQKNTQKLDIIACENMIGGSAHLKDEVYKSLDDEHKTFVDEYIGFPNAAVDRIVPLQKHDDPLMVSVEPFKEWVIDESQMARPDLKLAGVEYAQDLEPFIERKLFSVNTGHATVAYTGKALGYETIGDAIKDERVLEQLKGVLRETGDLLIAKWGFDRAGHEAYQQKIIERFENTYISDTIARVGRTPIRKLGFDERFIRPIREIKERGLAYEKLLETVGKIYQFDVVEDDESVKLLQMLKEKFSEVVIKTTGLKDKSLIDEIAGTLTQEFV